MAMNPKVRYITNAFFGIKDVEQFYASMRTMLTSLRYLQGTFAGDNLITLDKNLSFLSDPDFAPAFRKHASTEIEKAIIWRIYTVAWAARRGMRLDGDFVECACYKGVTARIAAEYAKLADDPARKYYLYDLFEHDDSMNHHEMPEHGESLFGQVKQRFADMANVIVTKGSVPEVLAGCAPEKIAFMHLDLNNVEAEVGALEVLFDRMTPGAVLVLDDYGWRGYWPQKEAEDKWFAARGYTVMELPTGQGMVIK